MKRMKQTYSTRTSLTLALGLLAAASLSAGIAQGAELIGCPGGGYGIPMKPLWQCYNGGCAGGIWDDGSYLVPSSLVRQVFPNSIPFCPTTNPSCGASGTTYDTFYLNINGNISFGQPVPTFTPQAIPGLAIPTIAAWYADVDFGDPGDIDISDAFLCIDPDRRRIIITWDRVGYYSESYDKRNSFQMILNNQEGDCQEANSFGVEFRYGRLEWTTGAASGGSGGLGGTPAVAGIDSGDTVNAIALPFSRTGNVLRLIDESNVDSPGVFKFIVAQGSLPACGNNQIELCEQCDDGNNDNNDACTNLCLTNVCGDGFVYDDVEACDYGQLSPGAELCPLGYEGTPICNNYTTPDDCTIPEGVPEGCFNVDECASSLLNNCSANASCADTIGAFTCACDEGFTGDGVTCDDVDECADDTLNDCGEFTTCTNTEGGFLCECSPGYASFRDGPCEEVDECAFRGLNDCNIEASCTNTDGSYTCACNEGYTGDGVTCEDIDECADPALNDCSEHAVCINTVGDFSCVCRGQFGGDGKTCALRCGDGVLDPGEDCDPGITNTSDFRYVENCRATCTFCGDRVVTPEEACDDGNGNEGDGCSSLCQVEAGWTCPGTGTRCQRDLPTDDTSGGEDTSNLTDAGEDTGAEAPPGDDNCGCATVRAGSSGGPSRGHGLLLVAALGVCVSALRRRRVRAL